LTNLVTNHAPSATRTTVATVGRSRRIQSSVSHLPDATAYAMNTPRKFTKYFVRFLTTTERTTLHEIFLE